MFYSRVTAKHYGWFLNKPESHSCISRVHFKRTILVGDALILMTPSNQSTFLKKLLIGECVEFPPLRGEFALAENKVKLAVQPRAALRGNTIFCEWK